MANCEWHSRRADASAPCTASRAALLDDYLRQQGQWGAAPTCQQLAAAIGLARIDKIERLSSLIGCMKPFGNGWCHSLLRAAVYVLPMIVVAVSSAQAQTAGTRDDGDHRIVYEFGWAADWSRVEGLHPKGGTFAFEIPAVERWLELEFGAEAIRADGRTEAAVGVLFKKPRRFSPRFEFMVGAGPSIAHGTGPDGGTFWGLSSVADFMLWPTKNVGWYVEPAYEVGFRDKAAHHGVGVTAGLLIGR
jgi:hypothetical protein